MAHSGALAAKAVDELTPDEDRNIFRFMLHLLLGLPPDPTGWNADPTAQSLLRDGITQFHEHFIDMSPADIDNLKFHDPRAFGGRGDLVGAPVLQRRRLKVLLSIYHAASRSQGKAINGMKITKAMFDDYCTVSTYSIRQKKLLHVIFVRQRKNKLSNLGRRMSSQTQRHSMTLSTKIRGCVLRNRSYWSSSICPC